MAEKKSNTPATVAENVVPETPASSAPKFIRKRAVTLPLFKWPTNVECFYRFDEPMFEAKPIKKGRAAASEENKKQPPTLVHVTNLTTGEQGQIIVGAVLKDILNDEYPDAGYVGRSFGITKHSIESGRAYATYSVVEVEAE